MALRLPTKDAVNFGISLIDKKWVNIDCINMMNVHHLELFYHVARCEGIVAACRQMPYGIQQPAMSAQVAKLEEELGVRLFERRPFRLTEAGRVLYDFISPFFGRLDDVEQSIRGTLAHTIRLAGLSEVMRDHVPALLSQIREKYPDLKVTLVEIDQKGAERLIADGETDLAITVLEASLPPGFRSTVLAKLPMGLLVPAGSHFRRTADVLEAGAAGRLPLISLPPHEMLPRLFQKKLGEKEIVWRTSLETSSQDLVAIYVRHGLGAGLVVNTPDLSRDEEVRFLPLKGFTPLPIGAFWRGELAEIPQMLISALQARSREFLGET
jgi:DNA-binding transcriptional LysR family regulator